MRWAITVALATLAVVAIVMLTFGQQIVGAFISGTPEEAMAATKAGFPHLSVMSICLPVLYILHVTPSAVHGMVNTVLPMISGIAKFVMRTGGVLLLSALIGENGIFLAKVLAWLGADLILIPSHFITMKRRVSNHE